MKVTICYSDEARRSLEEQIKRSLRAVGQIPGNVLPYTTASDIARGLGLLLNLLEHEQRYVDKQRLQARKEQETQYEQLQIKIEED